jgi:ribose 5-phosphate isomerase B
VVELKAIRVAIGADDAGAYYAECLKEDLSADVRVSSVADVREVQGLGMWYPDVAIAAARLVASGGVDRALLVCGTGLGMAIAANRVSGVRAVTAHDSYSVEKSVSSNHAQVLCIGQRVIGLEVARRLVHEWLSYEFEPHGASAQKVSRLESYER